VSFFPPSFQKWWGVVGGIVWDSPALTDLSSPPTQKRKEPEITSILKPPETSGNTWRTLGL
jgi:hypothetical protein